LVSGYFTKEELIAVDALIGFNIERLKLVNDIAAWDGRYDVVFHKIVESNQIIEQAKSYLKLKQIGRDEDVADFVMRTPEFMERGIVLNDLRTLLDIEHFFRNGHMAHDTYHGYPERDLFRFGVDSLDYLHSAAYFYNEAFDYYHQRKQVRPYMATDYATKHPYEFKRIQLSEEVMFRNFREAFINLIFFTESFINSVGIDAFLRGVAQNPDDENKLKGIGSIKNGYTSFLTLRQRIEHTSRIINGVALDTKQNPIHSYLQVSVELRNQYVHSSATKPKDYFSVEDWKQRCDDMISHECFAVLKAFWSGCYPNQVFPKVIYNEFHGTSFKGFQGSFMVVE
jgi:hypothetical protein